MTIIDRALQSLGLARRNTGFSGAQVTRLTADWFASLVSADIETKRDLSRLRGRARELTKNNPVAKHYLNLIAANVVGHKGIGYQSRIRNNDGMLNTALNQKIEDAWNEWGKLGNCTVDGKLSLRGVQDLAIRTASGEGEAFVRLVPGFANKFRFALQVIDADQIDHNYNRPAIERTGENEIRLGVEVDRWGRPLAYYVNPNHPSDHGASIVRERIPADQMIHLYDPLRVNQTRGVTWFHPVMLQLRMLEGYIEAELVAARTGAAKMGFLKYSDPSAFDAPDPNKNRIRFEANPGTIDTIPPGLEFQEWSPDHPANAFPNFVQAILRQVATGLGVSYNALANDLVGVNYSSMRSGLLLERDQWRRLQQWFVETLLQKVFEQWLAMALLSGELVLDSRDPRRFLTGKWQPRGWPWVDPLKDVQAGLLAIGGCLKSRDTIISEEGGDVEEVFEQLAEERKLAEQFDLDLSTAIAKPSAPKTGSSPDEADAQDEENDDDAKSGRSIVELQPVRIEPQSVTVQPTITVNPAPIELRVEAEQRIAPPQKRTIKLLRATDGSVTGAEIEERSE